MQKKQTLLVDVQNGDVKILRVKDELETFYELLQCRCIDIVTRRIGGKIFDIVCDDEGLLTESPRPSAITDVGGEVMLVGNLMFFHHDAEGNLVELGQSDIAHLIKNIRQAYDPKAEKVFPIVLNCEY